MSFIRRLSSKKTPSPTRSSRRKLGSEADDSSIQSTPSTLSAPDELKSFEEEPEEAKPVNAKIAQAGPTESRPAVENPVESQPVDEKPPDAEPVQQMESKPTRSEENRDSVAMDPKEVQNTESVEHFDVTQHVYEKTKSLWSWGKNVVVVKTFLNTTETVVSKILGIKGVKLEDVDSSVNNRLASLDDGFLNPTIERLVQAFGPLYDKMDENVRPIVSNLISKLANPAKLISGKSKSS